MLYLDVTRLYTNLRTGKGMTGVDRVALAYVAEFFDQACAVIRLPSHWLFFDQKRSRQIFARLSQLREVKLSIWDKRYYTHPANDAKNILLNVSHSGLESAEYQSRMQDYGLCGIYFLHDLIPIDYPEYCRKGEYERHVQRLLTMLHGDLIIVNSHYTLQRLEHFCHQRHLTMPPTIWAHLATNSLQSAKSLKLNERALLNLIVGNQPYFVCLGTIEGRKNHLLLLNVWRQLVRKLGRECPKLVLIGKRGWEAEQVFDILDRSIELKPVVVELNYCSNRQIKYLLDQSQALLFPSWVEGFGLPLIETLQTGTPVIASDIPVFRELDLEDVKLISPFDEQAWYRMVFDYINLNCGKEYFNRRPDQKTIVNLNRRFNWQVHFEKVKPVIMSLLKN